MQKHETARLLGMIQALDNREVDALMTTTWHGVLQRTTFEDATKRMGAFYRSGITRRITVQDVVTPDEQPDSNAWMDRSTHAKPEPATRYRQLRNEGMGVGQAIATVREEYPDSPVVIWD